VGKNNELIPESTLQQHESEPAPELKANSGHSRDLDKPATLMEANRANILAVDSRHHHAFASDQGSLAQRLD
jgi:hypothetical protein